MHEMGLKDFCVNNFEKIRSVPSELLWEKDILATAHDVFISILIVTYKRDVLLRDAIKSVKTQLPVEYTWELVIVDNDPVSAGLTSDEFGGLEIAVRYYRNKANIGHAGNLNRGVELCRGEWISFLHDDDLIVDSYLRDIAKYIKKAGKWRKPLAYIRTKHIIFSETSGLPGWQGIKADRDVKWFKSEKKIETLLRGCGPTYVNSCGSLVNKDAFIKSGGYNDDFYPVGDAVLGLVLENLGYAIGFTESVMGYYRMNRNESMKPEVLIEFIRADFQLREFLYARNCVTRLFGAVFRGIQFSNSVNVKLKVSGLEFKKEDWEAVHDIYSYKNRRAGISVLKVLHIMISGVLHPNVLISRLAAWHSLNCGLNGNNKILWKGRSER